MSRLPAALLSALLAGCAPAGPALVVDEVVVTPPLPGSGMSAAYFRLRNTSDAPIVVTRITSPDFARVEMHETLLEDGISRMRPLAELRLEPGAAVAFTRGGKHLMLAGPAAARGEVTLEFHAGDALLLTVTVSPAEAG